MSNREQAEAFIRKAVECSRDGTNPEAGKLAFQFFSSAIWADPQWGDGYFHYGNAVNSINCLSSAIAAWRRALEHATDTRRRAEIMCNLSWRLRDLGQEDEALIYAQQALILEPELSGAHANMAILFGDRGHTRIAARSWEKAVAFEPEGMPNHFAMRFGRALNLLFDRQLQSGFEAMEVKYEYRLRNFLAYPYPKWRGEHSTVFLQADQGLGDTLSFARFIPLAAARARYIHLYVQANLMRLFQHAFAHLKNVNIMPFQPACPFPAADHWSTMLSLPYALGLNYDQISKAPHIEHPRYTLPKTWMIEGQKLHVGIAWAGSPQNDIDRHRSIPVTQFLELYRVPGIQLYSLQVDHGESRHVGELHSAGMAGLVKDLSPFIHDIVDTTALLAHLDLVISCESALPHICGLIGKECWIPYSYLGRDWRIGATGEDILWYPKHRVFRQAQDRRWEPVFDDIVLALQDRIDPKPERAITRGPNYQELVDVTRKAFSRK